MNASNPGPSKVRMSDFVAFSRDAAEAAEKAAEGINAVKTYWIEFNVIMPYRWVQS